MPPVDASIAARTQPSEPLGAMIRLDLENLKVLGRSIPVALLIAVALVALGNETGTVMFSVIGFLVTLQLLSLDEQYRLPLLYGALPMGRRTVMRSHYLVSLGAMATGALLFAAASGVAALSGRPQAGALWASGLAGLASTLILLPLVIPIVVRFGSKAATGIMLTVVLGFSLGLGLLAGLLGPFLERNGDAAAAWAVGHAPAIGLVVGVVTILLWLASYAVATRLYEARDL